MDNGQNTIDPKTRRPYISPDELYGLFTTPGKPAPTDEDIERLLMERYAAQREPVSDSNADEHET